jgi:hypothetical protein
MNMIHRSLCTAVLFFLTLASSASSTWPLKASEKFLTATFSERAGPNRYTVAFPPELGGQEIEMPITGGDFRMAVDAEMGSARIIAWRQDIAPISINGASTGPITVSIDSARPSSGTYNSLTGTFNVTATFILEFDDTELGAFGFTSPFVLSATEQGGIYGVGQIGRIGMFLEGSGQFGLGEFHYTCQTTAEFVYDLPPEVGQPGDVNHDQSFDIADPVSAIGYLFLGNLAECPGAIEVNGDGQQDLSDAVYLLDYLFLGGSPPPVSPVACS